MQSPFATDEEVKAPATSVKVAHVPGGASSIVIGDGWAESQGGKDDRFVTSSMTSNQAATTSGAFAAGQQVEAAGQRKPQPGGAVPPGGRSQITF